jgi:hypothetical protein
MKSKGKFVNQNAIKDLMKSRKYPYEELTDLNVEWSREGYFLGIIDLILVVHTVDGVIGIKCRPYHLEYLTNTLEIDTFQKVKISCKGRQKARPNDKVEYRHEYFHVTFSLSADFYQLEGFNATI